jgi:hypothetical protein
MKPKLTQKKKKRGGAGKRKGGAFERAICKQLSLWASRGKAEDWYWRSSMSGGRATIRQRRGEKNVLQGGDVCCVGPRGHRLTKLFFIECKFYRDLHLDNLLKPNPGTKPPLVEFWNICSKEAAKHGRIPLLIAKQNGMEPIVVINWFTLSQLGGGRLSWMLATLPRWDMSIFALKEWLKRVPYESLPVSI